MQKRHQVYLTQWVIAVFLGALLLAGCQRGAKSKDTTTQKADPKIFTALHVFEEAFKEHRGNIQVTQRGKVLRILQDDTTGSRHQRFIIELSSGQTLLIAHNIDLAPRIPNISIGSDVSFHGEYEWNEHGGVVHWTHHDPDGHDEDGWIEYQGKIYQ